MEYKGYKVESDRVIIDFGNDGVFVIITMRKLSETEIKDFAAHYIAYRISKEGFQSQLDDVDRQIQTLTAQKSELEGKIITAPTAEDILTATKSEEEPIEEILP